jgi:glycosyltransferase involved in cell wall biosynthesis
MPTALAWDNPTVQKALGMADVLCFQRNVIVPEVYAAMDYWRALGKAVVVDLDDHYPGLPPSNPAFQYWIRNMGDNPVAPIEALAEGMRHADALTSPSKVICADWAHIIPGYWIPNWTRRAWYEKVAHKPVDAPDISYTYKPIPPDKPERYELTGTVRDGSAGEIIIGWGGSISHVDSWIYSGAIEALDRIFEKYPQARLKFCGHESRLDYIFKRWEGRIIRQDGVKPEDWPHVVATFDIGIAPLDTRPLDPPWREGAPIVGYDERRSWLKAVEYLSAGVPWVASKSETYNDLNHMGTLVNNTPDAWFTALDNKIKYLEREKEQALSRQAWAMRKVTFEANANVYGDIFGRIIADKITRGNKARLPGITYIDEVATVAA